VGAPCDRYSLTPPRQPGRVGITPPQCAHQCLKVQERHRRERQLDWEGRPRKGFQERGIRLPGSARGPHRSHALPAYCLAIKLAVFSHSQSCIDPSATLCTVRCCAGSERPCTAGLSLASQGDTDSCFVASSRPPTCTSFGLHTLLQYVVAFGWGLDFPIVMIRETNPALAYLLTAYLPCSRAYRGGGTWHGSNPHGPPAPHYYTYPKVTSHPTARNTRSVHPRPYNLLHTPKACLAHTGIMNSTM
jgi:hypothetical protein